jgi:hypothetical protein
MKALSPDDIGAWFAEKEFTADVTSRRFPIWSRVLGGFCDEPIEILEIGSFEGRSAIFFLEFMPKAKITCIDVFRDARESRFDRNVAPYSGRLTKMKSRAVPALESLRVAKKKFNLVYIDGDHSRYATFADSVGSWPLLKKGGILIWDDYKLHRDRPSATRPEHAIDLFCSAFDGCYRMLHSEYQVIVEKTAEWPEPRKRPEKKSLGRDLKDFIRRHASLLSGRSVGQA